MPRGGRCDLVAHNGLVSLGAGAGVDSRRAASTIRSVGGSPLAAGGDHKPRLLGIPAASACIAIRGAMETLTRNWTTEGV